MMDKVGVVRDEAGLLAMQQKIAELKERWERVRLMDTSRTFNTELMEGDRAGQPDRMLRSHGGRSAGPQREPWRPLSRGLPEARRRQLPEAHPGLPLADAPGEPELRYKPVVITEFQPKERKY